MIDIFYGIIKLIYFDNRRKKAIFVRIPLSLFNIKEKSNEL